MRARGLVLFSFYHHCFILYYYFFHKIKTSLLLVCIIIWLFILREWWLFKNEDTKTTWRYSIQKHWEAEITQKEKCFNIRIQMWVPRMNVLEFYTLLYNILPNEHDYFYYYFSTHLFVFLEKSFSLFHHKSKTQTFSFLLDWL